MTWGTLCSRDLKTEISWAIAIISEERETPQTKVMAMNGREKVKLKGRMP